MNKQNNKQRTRDFLKHMALFTKQKNREAAGCSFTINKPFVSHVCGRSPKTPNQLLQGRNFPGFGTKYSQ